VNRDPAGAHEVTVDLAAFGAVADAEATGIFDDDLSAANTAAQPDRVTPRPVQVAADGSSVTLTLPAASWVMLRAATA
jgi:alpha-N-arabinofuranosidase